MSELPERFITDPTPLWTISDWARYLVYSREWTYTLEENGILIPQRKTLGGLALFEPEYVEWAKVSVPKVAKRVSDLGLR